MTVLLGFYNTNQWIAQRGLDFAAIRRIVGRNLHQIAYLDQKIHQILECLDQKSIMSPSGSPEEEASSLPEVEEHSSSRPISPTATTLEVNHLGKVALDHRIIKLVDQWSWLLALEKMLNEKLSNLLTLSDDWAGAEQQRRLAKDMAADNTSCSVSPTTQGTTCSEERRQRLLVNNLSRCDDRPGGRVAVSDGVRGEGPKGGAHMYDKIKLSGILKRRSTQCKTFICKCCMLLPSNLLCH